MTVFLVDAPATGVEYKSSYAVAAVLFLMTLILTIAGNVILRMLEREGLRDHVVIVTRWYGGKHLGGDRFRHVQTATRAYLDEIGPQG